LSNVVSHVKKKPYLCSTMKRDSLLRYGTLASALLPVVPVAAKTVKGNAAVDNREQPNVIVIFADDLGYGDLECFGASRVQTPNVNALAQSGIRLTNVHAIAATSTPSRYGLLTGEYAFRHAGTDIARHLPLNAIASFLCVTPQ